jgi:hypothetical protein
MATAAQILRERELAIEDEIASSQAVFDIGAPLTDRDLAQAGMLLNLPGGGSAEPKEALRNTMPLLQEIEDVDEAPIDAIEGLTDRNSYNLQYVRYMKCQAIMALAAFEEGWSAFEELALKAYVKKAKFEDEQYRGDDPNKAFSLRVKRQAAEDFFRFIKGVVAESAATPKPTLAK